MTTCGELVPLRFFGGGVPVDDGDSGECLLSEGHEGEHLVKTARGYFLWIPDENFCMTDGKVCECDYIECYIYWSITNKSAKELLKKSWGTG